MKHASRYVHVAKKKEVAKNDEEDLLALDEANIAQEESARPSRAPVSAAPARSGAGFLDFLGFGNRSAAAPKAADRKAAAARPKPNANVDTHVVGLALGTLSEKADQIMETGDPFFCHNESCGAALSKISKVEKVSDKFLWTCEFCGMLNDVDLVDEELPRKTPEEAKLGEAGDENGYTVEYILEPAPAADEDAKVSDSTGIVVFCIDTSGSMCVTQEVQGEFRMKNTKKFEDEFGGLLQAGDMGYNEGRGKKKTTWVSRLQAVQAAVDGQIEALAKNDPKKKVVLVTFNNEVTIIGNGVSEPVVIAGSKLHSEEKLREIGSKYEVNEDISQTKEKLSQKLFDLETSGQTGLGPALIVSLGIAGQKPGSKIILCTDGLANVGPGSLEPLKDAKPEKGKTEKAASSEALVTLEKWYTDFGNTALDKGVSIDVISITADDCFLELLGKICDITNGTVDRVDPLKLKDNFKNILEKPVIATNVVATMLLHSGFKFKDDQRSVIEEKVEDVHLHGRAISKKTNQIGNVNADTEVFFEYTLVSDEILEKYKDLKTLPFQVQIRYSRLDGSKWMRLITQAKPVTADKSKVEENLDVSVLASNAAQRGAEMAQKGDYEAFKTHNVMWSNYIASNAKSSESQAVASSYVAMANDLNQEIDNLQATEAAQGLAYDSVSSEVRRQVRAKNRNDGVATKLYQTKNKKFG